MNSISPHSDIAPSQLATPPKRSLGFALMTAATVVVGSSLLLVGWLAYRTSPAALPWLVALSLLGGALIPLVVGLSRTIRQEDRAGELMETSDESLAAKQRRFTQYSIDSCNTSIFWFRVDARLVYVNDAATECFGYSRDQLLSMTVHDIDPAYSQEVWPEFWESMRQRRTLSFDSRITHQDGTLIPVEITTNFLEFEGQEFAFAFVNEISKRLRSETKLRESEARFRTIPRQAAVTEEPQRRQELETLAHMNRLSTMGELVAGIAHEVKQPLHAISNYVSAASISLDKADPALPLGSDQLDNLKECNAGIQGASQRANEIIQGLRAFTQKSEKRRDQIDVNQVVTGSIELVAFESRGSRTLVETELAERLPPVLADRVQIEQVVVNLLHNALEALKKTDSQQRRIVIRTIDAKSKVEVQVQDSGIGIPDDQYGKLFEAFYSTKENGLGMGLTISRTIVEDHNGRLWAGNNPDAGVTFHFSLPVSGTGSIDGKWGGSIEGS